MNVGGTGSIRMSELAALCTSLGLIDVRTYIQSGNIVFRSALSETRVQSLIEKALAQTTGKPIDVMVRTTRELELVLAVNPFPHANPSQVAVLFLCQAPKAGALKNLTIPGDEEVRLIGREAIIHYPNGMGRSKLKLASLGTGTVRNLNTVRKLAALMQPTDHS